MKKLAIIGASELGCLMAHHAITDNHYHVVGFYDDSAKNSKYFPELPVLGKIDDVEKDHESGKFDCIMIGIGYHRMDIRKQVYDRFANKVPFGTIVHSKSFLDSSCKVGKGVFVLPGCTVDYMASIGNNVTLQIGCVVAHHTIIGDHTFLGPGVQMAGLINVHQCCFLGLACVIKDCLTIGEHAVIGAGAVVISNVGPHTVSTGVPAKVVKDKA